MPESPFRRTVRGYRRWSRPPPAGRDSGRIVSKLPDWLRIAAAASWRLFVVGAALYYALLLFRMLKEAVLPLLFGLLITAIFDPAVGFLEKHRWPRWASALLAIVGLLVILAGIIAPSIAAVVREGDRLLDAIAQSWKQIIEWSRHTPLPLHRMGVADPLDKLQEELASRGETVAAEAAQGAMAVAKGVVGVVLAVFFAFFFLKDGPKMASGAARWLGRHGIPDPERAMRASWSTLGPYIRGATLIATFNAAMTGLALLIIGVPLVVPIMLLTFIGSFIPFAGPVVATTVAALVALAHGGITDALLVVGAGIAIQAVEGNVLQPAIMGRVMQMHPVVVLAAVTAGAGVAGLIGAFVAVPVVAALTALFAAFDVHTHREARGV